MSELFLHVSCMSNWADDDYYLQKLENNNGRAGLEGKMMSQYYRY